MGFDPAKPDASAYGSAAIAVGVVEYLAVSGVRLDLGIGQGEASSSGHAHSRYTRRTATAAAPTTAQLKIASGKVILPPRR